MKLIRDWFTGPNNDNFELSRALWFAGFCLGMFYQGYAIYSGQEFDMRTFAESVGIMLAGGGIGTAIKDYGAGKARSAS